VNDLTQPPARRWRSLGAIVAVALLVRLLLIAAFPGPNYFDGITESYVQALDNVLDGRGLTVYVDVAPLASPERDFRYEPFIDRPLGYVLLTLPAYAVWRSAVSIQILHAILGAAACGLMIGVGRRIVSEKAARRGAWLLAVWPLSARFEAAVLPDAVMPFFLLLSVWLILRARENAWSVRWSAWAGLSTAASMTMRPDVLFLPFFLLGALWLADRRWPSIAGLGSVAAVIVLVLGLHTWRNYEATGGQIAPLGLGNGISLWEGISQFGDTLGTLYGDTRLAEKEGYATWAYPDGVARDRARMSEAVGIIAANPGFYAVHMLKRIPVLLTPDWIMSNRYAPSLMAHLREREGNSIATYVTAFPAAAAARALVILLQWGTLILGAIAMWRTRSAQLLWVPFAVIAYYILVHLPTNTEARYFYPAIPFALMLAAEGWESVRRSVRSSVNREA
jgi:4-amino-4-deoxy-L-arabinose transferase-like glycosyltransferase